MLDLIHIYIFVNMISVERFKEIREELGFTQAAFAAQLGIKSTTADIERARVKLSGRVVMELLRQYRINPLWLYGESTRKYLDPHHADVAPKMITVDNLGQENILLVHAKAAAGYADNLGDPEYYEQLPTFTFPLPEYRNATFRGFQVTGDSMSPSIQPAEWVLAKAVGQISEVRSGQIYVIVEAQSIRIKEVQVSEDKKELTLVSLNPEYPPVKVVTEEVQEIWEYHSKVAIGLRTDPTTQILKNIYEEIAELRKRMEQ